MESNVYQAPASEILTAKPEAAGVALYVVAPWKFNLLFWATMGTVSYTHLTLPTNREV